MENLYRDIARRTGGHVYIGVVGPVRPGKSTMIKRIMELLVLPNIFVPILLVADCAIAYSQMKKPQKEEKKQAPANRLQPRR